ncbi:MAG: hypothetical protein AB7P12_09300 [Alphaproteobacteria bacterium]
MRALRLAHPRRIDERAADEHFAVQADGVLRHGCLTLQAREQAAGRNERPG